jgi:hypothetical protein
MHFNKCIKIGKFWHFEKNVWFSWKLWFLDVTLGKNVNSSTVSFYKITIGAICDHWSEEVWSGISFGHRRTLIKGFSRELENTKDFSSVGKNWSWWSAQKIWLLIIIWWWTTWGKLNFFFNTFNTSKISSGGLLWKMKDEFKFLLFSHFWRKLS